jgi:transcriptional regulator with XRE-family HTH domain
MSKHHCAFCKCISESEGKNELRLLRGSLSLRELAKKTGVSFPYLAKLESGQNENPSYIVVAKLAKFYRTDTNTIARAIWSRPLPVPTQTQTKKRSKQ